MTGLPPHTPDPAWSRAPLWPAPATPGRPPLRWQVHGAAAWADGGGQAEGKQLVVTEKPPSGVFRSDLVAGVGASPAASGRRSGTGRKTAAAGLQYGE